VIRMHNIYNITEMYSVLPDYQGISAGLESFGQRETSKQIEQAILVRWFILLRQRLLR